MRARGRFCRLRGSRKLKILGEEIFDRAERVFAAACIEPIELVPARVQDGDRFVDGTVTMVPSPYAFITQPPVVCGIFRRVRTVRG